MNGFDASKIRSSIFLACAIVIVANGCKKDSASKPGPPAVVAKSNVADSVPQSGPDGETIIRNLATKYSSAATYHDRAVLYLDYRLQGRNIQEPQPWATTWDQKGRLAAQWFNSQIRCDGDLLSCYVFDIETANLDNQHLLIPYESQLPIGQLFRDPIARHFIGGYSELPLDESDRLAIPKLIPPTISLLTHQTHCGWLQDPSRVERLADESIDGRPCYVVRCLSQGMTSDVWVDQDTSMLVQMSLPLKLLAGEVITSPEITDVFLLAKFHDAVMNQRVADEAFAIKPRAQATPVRKYVELPPAFPSELIGEIAPQFQLQTAEGIIRTKVYFDGKITAFLWLAGRSSYSAIGQLETLAKELSPNKYHLASVYSDAELKFPGTTSTEVVDELAQAIGASSLPSYYDQHLQASSLLRVKAIPSVIVMDGDAKIQFARALSDQDWVADVKAALLRVAAGDDVAVEMQAQYERFLESYHQQLVTVSAIDLMEDPESSTGQGGTAGSRIRRTAQLLPEQTWANRDFNKAGNIEVVELAESAGFNFVVLDGWRTVVELNQAGLQIARHELKLPEGEAADLIRVSTAGDQGNLYAVFSTLAKQVFLFDQTWNPIGAYPDTTVDHAGIRDCRWTDLDSNGLPELMVAFDDDHGVHWVDPISGQGKKVSESVAMSLTRLGDDMVITGQGKIGLLRTGLQNAKETELQFRRVASVGKRQICGLGVTDNGDWNAVGFDSSLNRVWTLAVGSQFFESQIEPIAVSQFNGESIWAIADTDDVIHLVSGGGKWLGDFQSDSRLAGVALATFDGKTSLVVSNAGGVECWNLNLRASPMRPASSGN